MYTKKILSLNDVKRVVVAAEAEAKRNNWNVAIRSPRPEPRPYR
jgi:uncharacterized protein GlcG (DUF336 family)